MTPQELRSVLQASGNALVPHLFQYTVTIVDTQGLPETRATEWLTFSGTLVTIADRLFVATASHCLENADNPDRYRIMADDGRFHEEGSAAVVATKCTPRHRPDVGLIELDRKSFTDSLAKPAIPISRITTDEIENRLATLMGTPYKSVSIFPGGAKGINATVAGYATSPIDVANWPHINAQKPLDATVDMFMRYPSNSPDIRDESGFHTDLPNPHGMSGGGVWDHGLGTLGVWSVHDSRLAGIQSAWSKRHGYVRVVRICHWVALVHQHCASVRPALECQFPEVGKRK